MRRVTSLGFEGFEGANGGSKLNSTLGVDVGVSVELVGRNGEMVPRAAAIYSIACLSGLFWKYLGTQCHCFGEIDLNGGL